MSFIGFLLPQYGQEKIEMLSINGFPSAQILSRSPQMVQMNDTLGDFSVGIRSIIFGDCEEMRPTAPQPGQLRVKSRLSFLRDSFNANIPLQQEH